MDTGFSAEELRARRRAFTAAMNARCPGWGTAVFAGAVNQYYFTGTMQDAVLFIMNDPGAPGGSGLLYGVRRSFDRARMESPLSGGSAGNAEEIIPINSYRDIAEKTGPDVGRAYIEGDTMPVTVLERLKKYFPASFASPGFLDRVIRTVRSVKSPAELALVRESGRLHQLLQEEKVPALLREGMSEAEFLGELCAEMYRQGWQGLSRFHQGTAQLAVGQFGFGTNSLYPSCFDGPGGSKGQSAASPFAGDGGRRLKKGDIVFADFGFGIGGYHSDRTQLYCFGAEAPEEFTRAQEFCIEIQKRAAELLRPGSVPPEIYREIISSAGGGDAERFMGVDPRHRVKFIGHGVGLTIDELPVIAGGFDEALEENMVIALEPKMAVPGIALAGVEDTYIVGPEGGICVTGGGRSVIRV